MILASIEENRPIRKVERSSEGRYNMIAPPSFPSYLGSPDDGSINSMQFSLKSAILSKSTVPLAFRIARTTMPVDALEIITLTAKFARSHATHVSQRC